MEKPSLPKGMRDFGPAEMDRRNHIMDVIRKVFQKYAFQPLETPAMENLSVLTGKYGDEGDQLLFRVLNSGDFLANTNTQKRFDSASLLPLISEKGLRYDLTVPFARYVVMNRHTLTFPFRRYQMQPVWRADRPQKGRYREFWQCDADVVGTHSLICEAEAIMMIREIFSHLGIQKYTIRLNHRALLNALAESAGAGDKAQSLFTAIDKLEKIGEAKVADELASRGFSKHAIETIFTAIHIQGTNQEKLGAHAQWMAATPFGTKGADDLREVLRLLLAAGSDEQHVSIDASLARGLNYYTGTIIEVRVDDLDIGSVAGGGRYDDLTRTFGEKEALSGVGISFGVDRLYDALDTLKLLPSGMVATEVLVSHLDPESMTYGLALVSRLRAAQMAAEIYPENAKLKKQLDYANKKQVPFVVVVGQEERATGKLTLKDMNKGTQQQLETEALISFLKKTIAK